MENGLDIGASDIRRTTVLSIVGPGRSGTTILASILGEVPGILSVGELRWLWRRGLLERRSCGCGQPPMSCPLWSGVVNEVLASPDHSGEDGTSRRAELREIVNAQREVATRQNRLRVIRSARDSSAGWPALQRTRTMTAQVCSALVRDTDTHVIVDTSKRAQEAAVLASIDSIEHYVLHVVRDPRGVAYSWRRRKLRRPSDVEGTMGTRRLLPSIARWIENCVGAELLRRQLPADRWMSIRYEDFVVEPQGTVERILAFLRLSMPTPFTGDDTVVLGDNHIIAGNPSRFRRGPVQIVADSEWRAAMGRGDQLAVVALTAPLLRRYGYPLHVRRPATAVVGNRGTSAERDDDL